MRLSPAPERPVSAASKSGKHRAKPWPERPVSAANKSGKQWQQDEKVRQLAHASREA